MLKQIECSNISHKQFKVYKEWTMIGPSGSLSPVIEASGSAIVTEAYELATATQSQGLYTYPLFNSVKSKYYSSKGNIINLFGVMKNLADWEFERSIDDSIKIIQIPQIQFGEQIKKGSISILLDDTGETFVDNSWGIIMTANPTYTLVSYDVLTQELTFNDGTIDTMIVWSFFDLNSGIGVFTIDGDTTTEVVFHVDFENAFITLSTELQFLDGDPQTGKKGNVFYDDGLIIFTSDTAITSGYTLTYKSTQTIYETEILITANKGEFNASQNPTAVDVTLSGSYEFETTAITNSKPAGTQIIKDVLDIKQKTDFTGSIGSITGSWNDFYDFSVIDPTGSYLSTYITTIGLYDSDENLVVITKLPKPIKKLPNYDLNFLIRFDT